MRNFVIALVGFLLVTAAKAQAPCTLLLADAVSTFAKPADATIARALVPRIAVRDAVKLLGPASRDVGSGLYVFEWDLTDGSVFHISSGGDLCAKSVASGIRPSSAPNNSLKSDVAKPRALG
jgi:hypothetical protein